LSNPKQPRQRAADIFRRQNAPPGGFMQNIKGLVQDSIPVEVDHAMLV
jgi:hypothetical protein